MKKKILLFLVIVAAVACLFTLSASAESVHEGKVDLNATVTLNDTNNTVLKLFDAEGNALIWYIDANSETGYSSIRADANTIGGPYVQYKTSWKGNIGSETAYQVGTVSITDASGKTFDNKQIVVFNIMDDDVLVNEGYTGNPVNCFSCTFQSCTNLQYAYLRLDTIALYAKAFDGCSNLVYANLPDLTNLKHISGGTTFNNCTKLFAGQELDLTRTSLILCTGDGAFNKAAFTTIKLPDTVTTIDGYTFQYSEMTSFRFPSGLTSMAPSVYNAGPFLGCAKLTTVTNFENTKITSICTKAFAGSGITSIKIPSTVKSIGNYAFQNCKSLVNVDFSAATNLKTIGTAAFEDCTALGRVDLQSTAITTIGNCAFNRSGMTYLALPSTLTTLEGNNNFKGNLTEVVGLENTKLTSIPYGAFHAQKNWAPEKIVIPNTVQSIGQYAFADVPMKSIVLGAGVTSMSTEVLTGCKALETVYMPSVTLTTGLFNFNNISGNVRFFVTSTDETVLSSIATYTNVTEANIITYETYSANPDNYKSGKYVISGYNTCDAFYNSVHKKPDGTDKACETDFVCTICSSPIEGHTPVITIEYKNGFAVVGVKTVTCSCDNAGTYDADPIFVTKGYSIKENNGYGIISTYVINDVALKEYEDLNGAITFGIIMANANFDGQSAFMSKNDQNKYVLNSSYGVQLEITNRNYAKINATIDKFTQEEASLNLVMALYVIEDDKVSYIQHEGTYAGEITKDATLDIVTITKIAEINNIQITLPQPALVPAGNDEE